MALAEATGDLAGCPSAPGAAHHERVNAHLRIYALSVKGNVREKARKVTGRSRQERMTQMFARQPNRRHYYRGCGARWIDATMSKSEKLTFEYAQRRPVGQQNRIYRQRIEQL